MDHVLAADGASYCPSFTLLDDALDDTLAAALGRPVTDGCPEPRADESGPQWWAVTAMVGVATDHEGRPAHGDDSHIVDLGQGDGVLLVTDRSVACALTTGQLRGDAASLALSFDLDEVAAVAPDRRRAVLRKHVRSLTIEVRGASWGGIGLAVAGALIRSSGMRDTPVTRIDADELVVRLARS